MSDRTKIYRSTSRRSTDARWEGRNINILVFTGHNEPVVGTSLQPTKRAESLGVLKALQAGGRRAFNSDDFSPSPRERLLANGFLLGVMKDWLILSGPSLARRRQHTVVRRRFGSSPAGDMVRSGSATCNRGWRRDVRADLQNNSLRKKLLDLVRGPSFKVLSARANKSRDSVLLESANIRRHAGEALASLKQGQLSSPDVLGRLPYFAVRKARSRCERWLGTVAGGGQCPRVIRI